jgi:dTDP-glucose 4,6-dehydratase
MTTIVTGGLGFIGKNFIKTYSKFKNKFIINIDTGTYASKDYRKIKFENIRYLFDINDKKKLKNIFQKYKPEAIINFAAETHVDRSIKSSKIFFKTNVLGTLSLLEASRDYINKNNIKKFKFIHISTDEVFGSLKKKEKSFTEKTKYNPLNPYAASKASSDHLVRSFVNTYNFPAIITNCSNNFGPFQNKEKFIPMIISKAIKKQNIPIYGNGKQIRDWIFVDDHCEAIIKILNHGKLGESYNIGATNEVENIELAKKILNLIQKKLKSKFNFSSLLTYVNDRLGHDYRYSINSTKIQNELNWKIKINFQKRLEQTIDWYLKRLK